MILAVPIAGATHQSSLPALPSSSNAWDLTRAGVVVYEEGLRMLRLPIGFVRLTFQQPFEDALLDILSLASIFAEAKAFGD